MGMIVPYRVFRMCSKTNYIEEVTFITPNEDEPDYNPDITYEELPDGNIKSIALINMIDFVALYQSN